MNENSETDWCPTASLPTLQARAQLLATVRSFFAQRHVMEVETPLLSAAASTDPHLAVFKTNYLGPSAPQGQSHYLTTSPEFAMKRLLSAGSGAIYQICKAFRNEESGQFHNPEFTLLEWYRPGFDHQLLMDEVEKLIGQLLNTKSFDRLSYHALFKQFLNINPFTDSTLSLRHYAETHGINLSYDLSADDRDGWLTLLMTHLIEPELGQKVPVFIYDYPASQAMLARIRNDEIPVAERFELYYKGVELANGFHELADANEQARRFSIDIENRKKASLPVIPMDENLISALHAGFPDCAGVALGIDRLLMLITKANHISDVISFPIYRA